MRVKEIRRSYSREFKLEAVRLCEESGKSSAQIASELGISANSLYNWRKQLKELKEGAFKSESQLTPEQQEIKRLRIEVARLKEQREILKKATAFFASEPK